MMRKKAKIGIIILSMGVLVIVGIVGTNYIGDDKYSMRDLVLKYPLISDLKIAVDSGQLDYNKLPPNAKIALEKYESSKDTVGLQIIEGINP